MTNRPSLLQLTKMGSEEANALPTAILAMLQEDAAKAKAALAAATTKIAAILDNRFADAARSLRKIDGKDTGTVTITDDEGNKIKADLPKKVEWDQALLQKAIAQLKEWNENPDEYVTTEIKVSETKYNAWPTPIKTLFTPARTVKTGTPTYKIEEPT